MPWIQLSATVDQAQAETVEDCFLLLGACSVTLQDAEDQPLLEPLPGEMPLWQRLVVTGLFTHDHDADALYASLNQALGEQLPLTLSYLDDQDWERVWMERFHPMQFGERIWICPSWAEPPDANAVNVMLDPGLAFGTGTHPTTALCLRWLDQHPAYPKVLDFGCGSGILAIAALLCGSEQAWGIDIDPQALTASRNNARSNGIADERFTLGQDDETAQRRFDLVIANILAGPLESLAERLVSQCDRGGHLVLSGLLQEQTSELITCYESLGCTLLEQHQEDDWALLAFSAP